MHCRGYLAASSAEAREGTEHTPLCLDGSILEVYRECGPYMKISTPLILRALTRFLGSIRIVPAFVVFCGFGLKNTVNLWEHLRWFSGTAHHASSIRILPAFIVFCGFGLTNTAEFWQHLGWFSSAAHYAARIRSALVKYG